MDKLGKIRRHDRIKLLKIRKISKFGSRSLKKKTKIIIARQNREIFRTWYDGGYKLALDRTTLVSYIFARLRRNRYHIWQFY